MHLERGEQGLPRVRGQQGHEGREPPGLVACRLRTPQAERIEMAAAIMAEQAIHMSEA